MSFSLLHRVKLTNYVYGNNCLFGVFVPSRIFHLYGDVTNTGEGLQILTYARHPSGIV